MKFFLLFVFLVAIFELSIFGKALPLIFRVGAWAYGCITHSAVQHCKFAAAFHRTHDAFEEPESEARARLTMSEGSGAPGGPLLPLTTFFGAF